MAYLGKNYERDFQLDFLNYLAKLKNNGSLAELIAKKDDSYCILSKDTPETKAHPQRGWLGSKQYQMAETVLLSGTKR